MDVIKIIAWATLRECRYWHTRALQKIAIVCWKIDRAIHDRAIKASRKFQAIYGIKKDEE